MTRALRRHRFAMTALAIAAPVGMQPIATHAAEGPAVAGLWLVEAKDAVIDIRSCGERLWGAVVWLKEPRPNGSARLDDNNPDPPQRTHPVCDLKLLYDFKAAGPNSGRTATSTAPTRARNIPPRCRLSIQTRSR
jgi:uncharacterized protein (DUF2147 family)